MEEARRKTDVSLGQSLSMGWAAFLVRSGEHSEVANVRHLRQHSFSVRCVLIQQWRRARQGHVASRNHFGIILESLAPTR